MLLPPPALLLLDAATMPQSSPSSMPILAGRLALGRTQPRQPPHADSCTFTLRYDAACLFIVLALVAGVCLGTLSSARPRR